jgi:putative tricarboxylic transport membrane protein
MQLVQTGEVFYVPGNMSNDAYNYWANAISTMYDTPQWKETMGQNGPGSIRF